MSWTSVASFLMWDENRLYVLPELGLLYPSKRMTECLPVTGNANTHLVPRESTVLLAVLLPLDLWRTHLEVCLVKPDPALEHDVVLYAFEDPEGLVHPVFRCGDGISVNLGREAEASVADHIKEEAHPF